MSDEPQYPFVVNPDAVGDPDQTPVVYVPPGFRAAMQDMINVNRRSMGMPPLTLGPGPTMSDAVAERCACGAETALDSGPGATVQPFEWTVCVPCGKPLDDCECVPALPDPVVDPGGYGLAVAEIREARAKDDVTDGWWTTGELMDHPGLDLADAEFVAFETPAHALAEVALWRGIVERHGDHGGASNYRGEPDPALCHGCAERWPCPDLLAVVAAARAYMGAS